MQQGGIAADQLASYIERIERLEEEKANLMADIKAVKNEAKALGFDIKTINTLVKLRKLTDQEREEQEALLDIYKAALGMLFDTPLGEAARRRLGKPPAGGGDGDGQTDLEDFTRPKQDPEPVGDDGAAPAEAIPDDADPDAMGADAAKGGKPVTSNPFLAGDKRRAIWDQAWCRAKGSDGMEIPEAWRRVKEKPAGRDQKGAAE
ncbi:DUF2312 domain-containing protein [Thalassospira sp.]|uniref:DUF2312 domain-containing protein n=1 Tax=Thalassospira sp. TaxID=1912094 RepID=UPI003AA8FF56